MISARLIGLFALVLAMGSSVHADPVRWGGPDGNGHLYEMVPVTYFRWDEALNAARSSYYHGTIQGDLVSIGSQAEQDFLFNTFNPVGVHAAWIGLTDDEAYGGQESGVPTNDGAPYWVWTDGTPVTYVNWVQGPIAAPNNQFHVPEGEDYTELVFTNTDGTPGRWNDLPYFYSDPNQRYYIVEFVPEANPVVLVSLAIGCLLVGRKLFRSMARPQQA